MRREVREEHDSVACRPGEDAGARSTAANHGAKCGARRLNRCAMPGGPAADPVRALERSHAPRPKTAQTAELLLTADRPGAPEQRVLALEMLEPLPIGLVEVNSRQRAVR